ncbi:MAG: HIT family protein, partial [Candidatus Zixiibacteriota bacterium]
MTDGECIFCSVVAGKVPAKKVYEDESVLAFLDINPRNPGHTLVVPKKHFETIFDMPDSEAVDLFKVVKQLAVK